MYFQLTNADLKMTPPSAAYMRHGIGSALASILLQAII